MNVLIYVPSYEGIINALVVESLAYIHHDCYDWKEKGYKFFFMIGKRMAIHNARQEAVNWALENEIDYIFWFDDDMVLDKAAPPLFTTLINHNKDFVAPLFFQRRPPYLPLLFKRNSYIDGIYTTYDNMLEYERGLIEVDGVGFGCALTKVEMFKKIPKPHFLQGETFGEDLYFCDKAKAYGYKIYCDTTIQVGHIGDSPVVWESSYKNNKEAAIVYTQQKKQKDFTYMDNLGGVVDIVMPCFHNFDVTKEAIESILNNTIACKWSLILINDGGDSQLERYFKQIEKYRDNVKHITNKKALGCVKATNQGLRMAKAPFICLVNNDIVIPDNMRHWLHRMIQVAKNEKVGAVSCVSNYVAGIQNVIYNSKIISAECISKFLIPFVAVYRKDVLDKIGLFDESFQDKNGASSGADIDHSIRMSNAGYGLKIVRDIFIYHYGSKSLEKASGSMDDVMKLHEKYIEVLKQKYGNDKIDNLFAIDII